MHKNSMERILLEWEISLVFSLVLILRDPYVSVQHLITAPRASRSFCLKWKLHHLIFFPDLFLLAHRLVEFYPEWVISWFAVGSYYFLIGKQELSRRYLSRATQLDRVFGPSWLAYGHSFALENEHDQAIAAYFKVRFFQRLMENVYKMGTKKFETF